MNSALLGIQRLLPNASEGLSEQQLGGVLESVHRGMTPLEAESFDQALRSIGNFARSALPVVAPLAASLIPGGALVAPLVSSLVSQGLGAAGGQAAANGQAAAPQPPGRVGPSVAGRPPAPINRGAPNALQRLLHLAQSPQLLQALAGQASGLSASVPVGEGVVSNASMLNLLGSLAERALEETALTTRLGAPPLTEAAWHVSADPDERADALWATLSADASFSTAFREADYDEADYDEADYDEADYDEVEIHLVPRVRACAC